MQYMTVGAARHDQSRMVCQAVVVAPHTLCASCRCQVKDCLAPRTRQLVGQLRWCKRHGDEFATALKKRDCYVTASGVARFGPNWSPALRFVARFGFVFGQEDPPDLSVLVEIAKEWAGSSAQLEAAGLTALFLAHCLKWPPAVAEWQRLGRLDPPTTAADFVRHLRQVVVFCHDKRWPAMFAGMNSGRMHAATGLAVQCVQLGILQSGDGGAPRSERHVRLGPAGSSYVICQDLSGAELLVDEILKLAQVAVDGMQWPRAAGDDATTLLRRVLQFAASARSLGGLKGGRSTSGGYLCRHFARVILVAVDECAPEASASAKICSSRLLACLAQPRPSHRSPVDGPRPSG